MFIIYFIISIFVHIEYNIHYSFIIDLLQFAAIKNL